MEIDTEPDDMTVIRRVLAGETDAFRCLVQRYEKSVFHLVRNLLADVHQAEDIAQESFLAAFRNLRQYDPQRSSFATWLLTIARNKCLNALQKKSPIVSDDLPPPVDYRTPADECIEREILKSLDNALEELSPVLKTVFVLAEFVGLTSNEIAEVEGVPAGTVRARLSRARQQLRIRLSEYTEGTR